MKKYNRIILSTAMLLAPLGVALTACNSEENLYGVDLRYEELGKLTVNDFYQIDAEGSNVLQFRVKSDHPWRVYGSSDWYTIDPAQGIANEVATVTITSSENTELDDRQDVINIRSDYWIGKTFVMLQKGIAYLRTDVTETGITKDKEAGVRSFTVEANQPWTVEVTEGESWLSVKENASGGADKVESQTQVTLEFEANKGEKRVGKLVVYDRHHSEGTKVEIICSQDGIVLNPIIPDEYAEFGYFRIEEHLGSTVEIKVESNTKWSVSKENEADDWYSFLDGVDFDNNGTIRVALTQNDKTEVRIANLILRSEEVEGSEVVVKTVTVKQANLPKADRTTLNAGGLVSWTDSDTVTATDNGAIVENAVISKAGFRPGNFKLHMSGTTASSRPYLFLKYKEAEGATVEQEIRIRLNDSSAEGKLWTFVTPWGYGAPQVANWYATNKGVIDMTASHTLELDLTEYKGYIKIQYILDGNLAHEYITDGTDRTCWVNNVACYGAYIMPYNSTMKVRLGCDSNRALFEWFEYTPRVDWKD